MLGRHNGIYIHKDTPEIERLPVLEGYFPLLFSPCRLFENLRFRSPRQLNVNFQARLGGGADGQKNLKKTVGFADGCLNLKIGWVYKLLVGCFISGSFCYPVLSNSYRYTPRKTNMELGNESIEKEHRFLNLHFCVPCSIS